MSLINHILLIRSYLSYSPIINMSAVQLLHVCVCRYVACSIYTASVKL